uniref:Virion structural protein n=1 Tax=Pantoea phage Survivor TaxID=3232176 RepID=A0AAU8KZ59_9CAUD
MIIISKTPKMDVLAAIDRERALAQGMLDTLTLLKDSGPEALAKVEGLVEKNAVLNSIQKELKRTIAPSESLLHALEEALNNLVMWLPKLRVRIEKSKTTVYDAETLTFKEKGILDVVSSVNFYTRYGSMVLDILFTQAHKEVALNSYLNKVDFNFFNDTAKYFVRLTIKFNDSVSNLDEMISDLSDELFDGMSEQIIRGQLGDKGVSVQHNLAPHELNPLYWYKNMVMKKDVASIASSHEKIEMLAAKIARLNNQRTGQQDPALERAIETYQNEIIKNQAKILNIEARYNGK